MPDELEERLRSHARSFDSLLSLIPAKMYYGEDVSDQWKRKKQTPEEKRAAKMAKLDPDNWKSAKDVMDERSAAAKRKRDDDESHELVSDGIEIEAEKPKALQAQAHKAKKQKTSSRTSLTSSSAADTTSLNQALTVDEKKARKAEKKALKQQAKLKQKEKLQRQKQRKTEAKSAHIERDKKMGDVEPKEIQTETVELDQILPVVSPAQEAPVDDGSTAPSSPGVSDIMSPVAESGTSSISSIQPDVPASFDAVSEGSKHKTKLSKLKTESSRPSKKSAKPTALHTSSSAEIPMQDQKEPSTQDQQLSEVEKNAARERLTAAISSFRTQRKADDTPRSRQDLLNARRVKEDARREAKKEQRRKENEEAARRADEEIERRFSPGGSGSLLGSPRSPLADNDSNKNSSSANNFSFGRIAFGDGSEIDVSNTSPAFLAEQQQRLQSKHKRGPQDVNTALQAAKNKETRLAGLDEQKRKQIEEKDMWLNAKRRAHGERIKDDTSLLKKALKRQETQKKKSEKEWQERKDGVQKSQDARQKKRTENLAKRKDDRKHGKKVGSAVKSKKVKRPGFEGSFRGRTGGTKKK